MKKYPKCESLLISESGEIFSATLNRNLKLTLSDNGYLVFGYGKTPRKLTTVHRAVVETYIRSIPKGMVVNHKDGNKLNNHVSNLEIVTYKQNSIHARDIVGIDFSFGKRSIDFAPILTAATLYGHTSMLKIGEALGVSKYSLQQAADGVRYKEYSDYFETRISNPFKKNPKMFRERNGRFQAIVYEGKKQICLGTYSTSEEATKASREHKNNSTLKFTRKNREAIDEL